MKLTKLWIMLNQLNKTTKTFKGELSPYSTPKVKVLEAMTKIYTDANLKEIKNEQVNFLEIVLKNIYKFNKGYDFSDKYWFEEASEEEQFDRSQIKQLIISAHDNAVVI